MATSANCLAIICGKGQLPHLLAQACQTEKRPYLMVGLEGLTPPLQLENHPHVWMPPAAVNKIMQALTDHSVSQVIFAGGMEKPSLKNIKLLRPDAAGARILTRLLLKGRGDDSLLRLIGEEFTSRGFELVGAHEVLTTLLTPKGQLGQHAPTEAHQKDIEQGLQVATTLGQLDVGQGVVIEDGVVLGVEALEGTDALIERCATLRRQIDDQSGVLVKARKPQQSEKFDLPTIGPDTIIKAAQVGLAGIALTANSSLLLDREKTIALADEKGLFVVGV